MRTYQWVMTVQLSTPAGTVSLTSAHGVVAPGQGQTRAQVFQQLLEKTVSQAEDDGRSGGFSLGNPVVIFFSLEPDKL
jgi:hypothetical protein